MNVTINVVWILYFLSFTKSVQLYFILECKVSHTAWATWLLSQQCDDFTISLKFTYFPFHSIVLHGIVSIRNYHLNDNLIHLINILDFQRKKIIMNNNVINFKLITYYLLMNPVFHQTATYIYTCFLTHLITCLTV